VKTTVGAMDQRITLQRFAAASDGYGGQLQTWADYATNPTVWANVIAKAGREGMTEDRMTATFVVLFTIWNRRDIDLRDRIVWQGVTYNIRGIRDEGARAQRIVIEAERGVAS
jgi:SPP1 family predicted phage head-tail adaptor